MRSPSSARVVQREKQPRTNTREALPETTEAAEVYNPLADTISQLGAGAGSDAQVVLLHRALAAQPDRATQAVQQLQRQYGNRYVQRVLSGAQPAAPAPAPPVVEAAIVRARGGGQALDSSARAQLEPAFGADFGQVRVHTDGAADQLNRALHARAFTTGQDIFFRQGAYQPGNSGGRELLAHELTHVVQQTCTLQRRLVVGAPGDRYEQEADAVAQAVGQQAALPPAAAPLLNRQIHDEQLVQTKPASPKTASFIRSGAVVTRASAAKGTTARKQRPKTAHVKGDSRFRGVMNRLNQMSAREKAHQPASKKAADARAAAEPPKNDRSSRAQANQVEVMDQQQAREPDKDSFLRMLRAELERIAPRNMKDTEEFKEQNKAGQLEQALTANVDQQKAKSTRDIKRATQAQPRSESVPPKRVVALPAEARDAPPADLGSKDVLPLPKSASEISAEKNKKSAAQLMAGNDIDEQQLKKANEPQFTAALKAKHELEKDADNVPKTYRAGERAYLNAATGAVISQEHVVKGEMRGGREKSKTGVKSHQLAAKKKEEAERKQVADNIQGMYETTRKKVEDKLNALDGEVKTIFDAGEKRARERFETYVDRRMTNYKLKRYILRPGGSLLWIRDQILELPDEVNRFYEEGRDQYIRDMDAVLVNIADTIETRLKEAKDEIANGKQQIHTYVQGLTGELRQVGQAAERDVSSRFDELEQSVDDKKEELAQELAQRYKEARDKLDTRIKELQAENQGLLKSFTGKIKDAINILREFKDRIVGLLRQSGDAIRRIVKDPIGFLKNLIGAVRLGFNQFVAHIGEHLKRGFMGWLFGTLAAAGVEIPAEFSLKAIFGLVMQVLGLTSERIRAKLVKQIGAKNVERTELAWRLVSTLIREGPAGLWAQAREYLGNLREIVVDGIRNWVIEQIIKQGVLWVLSLFSPASALLKAIQAIYKVVMFFIERREQILQLVEAVVASVSRIVAGQIDQAANWVEQAMGRMVPVMIGFLASLLGLGGISEKIKSIIGRVQKPVDDAVDKVLAKIVSGVKKVFAKVKGGVGKTKLCAKGKQLYAKGKELYVKAKGGVVKLVAKVKSGVEKMKERFEKRFGARRTGVGAASPEKEITYPQVSFTDGEETHKVWVKSKGVRPTVMISSDASPILAFLASAENSDEIPDQQKQGIPRARTIVANMNEALEEIELAQQRNEDVQVKQHALAAMEEELAQIIKEMLKKVSLREFNEKYKLEGIVATYASIPRQVADLLTPDHQPQAGVLKYVADLPIFRRRVIEDVAAGSHADGGMAINLHFNRHIKGRTYGRSPNTGYIDNAVSLAARDEDKQRTEVIKVLKKELREDVKAMKAVANRPNTDAAWQDIQDIQGAKKADKDALINSVRSQILAGEDRIADQDLDRLKNPK